MVYSTPEGSSQEVSNSFISTSENSEEVFGFVKKLLTARKKYQNNFKMSLKEMLADIILDCTASQ